MWQDPVVEEIHRIREEHAKKFNGDLQAIYEDIRKRQAQSGRKVVSRPPRKLKTQGAARCGFAMEQSLCLPQTQALVRMPHVCTGVQVILAFYQS